jgi:uncharacterized protein (UPF0248 family)
MMPIHALLQRIRWDPEFARAEFTLGYLDRVRHGIVTVPIDRVSLTPGNHFAFDLTEDDGSVHPVPFHRVRELRRNGELIWQRGAASRS